jgi:hypothetical protein
LAEASHGFKHGAKVRKPLAAKAVKFSELKIKPKRNVSARVFDSKIFSRPRHV